MLGFLGLFVVLFLGVIPSVFVNKSSSSPVYEFFDFDLEFSAGTWNTSDYINFSGPLIDTAHSDGHRIFIDDNDPSRNWSVYASNYSWVTGSGTFPDPYVIENLFIDGNGTGGMIFIQNSDKYFIIRDNWFNYSAPDKYGAGVVLHFTTNGRIEDNFFTYTCGGVILELLTSNITVDDNVFISDHTTAGLGVAITTGGQANEITISNNKIRNYYSPMAIFSSFDMSIEDNYVETTIWEDFTGGSPIFCNKLNDTDIIRNILAKGFAFGTFKIHNSGGSGNVVTNNTVMSGEPLIFGPETSSSLKTSQDSNQISLTDSHNNLIAHNVMLGSAGGSGEASGEAIPGFDIFVLLGLVGVISALLVIIKHKKV